MLDFADPRRAGKLEMSWSAELRRFSRWNELRRLGLANNS
jgi:hypothetical protein